MKTIRQIASLLLLVFVTSFVVGPTYYIGATVVRHEAALMTAYVIVPMVLAWIVHRTGSFSSMGYTVTEERLFGPYYRASRSDQIMVVGAIGLLGLLPVLITGLLLPDLQWPGVDALSFGFVVITYLSTLLIYGGIFIERVREHFRRLFAPGLIVLTSLIQAYSSHYAANSLAVREWALIVLSLCLTGGGAALLLRAARSIADRKTRVEAEVAFAAEIQQRFLQSQQVRAGSVAAFASSRPARQLGGDFFHLLDDRDGRLIAAVGDVSGHSFGAGLIMTMLKTSLENFVAFGLPLSDVFSRLNDQIIERTSRSVFATLACVEIDTESGECTLWNAGHMPVLRFRSRGRRVETIHTPGLALGLTSDVVYAPTSFRLEPDDQLILCSDGLVETRDDVGEVRSIDFVQEVALDVLSQVEEPRTASEDILDAIGAAHREPFLADDATLIVLRFDPLNREHAAEDGRRGSMISSSPAKQPVRVGLANAPAVPSRVLVL